MSDRFFTTARIGGLLYLTVIICAGFAQIVRVSLVESGDATATANNVRDAEWLFRAGFVSDTVAFAADAALALVFYALLRPVNETLALLAAFFRLAQAAVLGINMLNQFAVLLLLSGDEYLDAFDAGQLDALTMLALEAHSYGYLIGLVFFALASFFLGYLVYRSGFLPKILGVLLMTLVALGYLLDSLTSFLGADQEALSFVLITPAAIVEIAFCVWLLVRGGAVPARGGTGS